MSTSFLRLPIDIPWERICVSADMLDPRICDREFPPKWQSSIAVFKYRPEEDYQEYPNHDVIYLKVAVTVSGYQPRDKEIEGMINWSGLSVQTLQDVEALLNEYHPCTGALIQISVAPTGSDEQDAMQYPYFLDFEPKKRELYEMATDTKEKMSRSLESLNVGKSSGSTQSQEVLDIDSGGGGGGSVTVFGTGGGFNYQHTGQWGTKQVGTNEAGVTRTTDQGTERRETASFSTQLTQLYHLLDSYHLGTNRVLFFVQPRPHTLEEPSGFVRGPRPVEGIQEFFLVVLKPKKQEDICVSVRVDTAHLAEVDILDYAHKKDEINLSVSVPPPESNDAQAVQDGYDYMEVWYPVVDNGSRRYKCYTKTVEQVENYTSPWGDYKIDVNDNGGYTVTSQSNSYGGYSVSPAADGSVMPTKVWATARKCYNDGGDWCVDCPDTWHARSANSSLSLVVNLVSREPIQKVGTDQVLLITTRGLCCCAGGGSLTRLTPGLVDARPLGSLVAEKAAQFGISGAATRQFTSRSAPRPGMAAAPAVALRKEGAAPADTSPAGMSPRDANGIAALIRAEVMSIVAPGRPESREPTPFTLSDFFIHRLETRARASQRVTPRDEAVQTLLREFKADRKGLEAYYGVKADKVTALHVGRTLTASLAQAAGIDARRAVQLRLAAVGLEFADEEKPASKGRQSRSE